MFAEDKIGRFAKYRRWVVLFLMVPVAFYVGLVALIEYDRINSALKPNDLPSLVKSSQSSHEITFLSSGLAAFWARIQLIRSAKESIEMEYFIYDLDQASRIITQELLKKSKEGVKVRLIVDFSQPVFQLNPYVAAFLIGGGVEVRYYNTSTMLSIFSVQHRSHRKLLIVDGKAVITGGRNVADDYFEISNRYNFFDTDLLIRGEIVKSIRESYEIYWNSELAHPAQELAGKVKTEEVNKSMAYLAPNNDDEAVIGELGSVGKELFESSFKADCRDITFATDHPGSSVSQRQVYNTLIAEAASARSEMLIESPYFLLRNEGLAEIKRIVDRGVKFKALTNSLASTDAYYTAAALSRTIKDLFFAGIELWVYDGTPRSEAPGLSRWGKAGRWGLHSKRGVIDDKTTIIGTYNIDPRSANLNSELVVICRDNKELAGAVKADILARLEHSYPVVKEGCLNCGANIVKNSDWASLAKFILVIPVSGLFDFLL